MKKFGMSLALFAVFCLMTSVSALASEKNLKKTLTIKEPVVLMDTLLEKGTYQIKFDAKSGEVHVIKDGDVVAKAKGNVEMRNKKANYDSVSYKTDGGKKVLTGLTFAGDRRNILIESSNNQVAGE